MTTRDALEDACTICIHQREAILPLSQQSKSFGQQYNMLKQIEQRQMVFFFKEYIWESVC